MKKLGCSLVLMLVVFSSLVLGGVSLSEPLNVYNFGDRLYVSADGLRGATSGNLNVDLVCGNTTVNLEKMSARRYGTDEDYEYSLPYKILNKEDLEIENLDGIMGECQVVLSLGSSVSTTKTFTITNDVYVTVSLDKASYDPGEAVTVTIEAVKANGDLLNGFVEGSNASDFNKAIEEGVVEEVFSMPETIEAGTYDLNIWAYDVGSGGTLNGGKGFASLTINKIASSIVLSLSDVDVVPGNNFTVGVDIFDQSGKEMEGAVSLKIVSPENEETEITIQSGEFEDLDFVSNSSAGVWKVISSFDELVNEREFEMLEIQKIDFDFEDSVLSITNVGNVLYNRSIAIQIGEELIELDLNIEVGEVRKFALNAPNGEYEVLIDVDGDSISRQVLLTGNAISVNDLKKMGSFKGYLFVWIFLIVVLGGVGVVLFMKYRKTKTMSKNGLIEKLSGILEGITGKFRGKVSDEMKSRMDNSLNFTKKSPAVQSLDSANYSHEDKSMMDLTKKSVGSAESALVMKGEKYMSAVIALNVKNHDELSDVAKEALHASIEFAEKSKGLIDLRNDYVFAVFSPLITKTYNNEALAVKAGMEILNSLNEYNKKFKDKIKFNIGVHVGELVTSKEGGKLKYTSIGNTISFAKRISDSNNEKLIVSEEIRKKLLRDMKVVKAKDIGESHTYEVSEMKNAAANAAKLKDLLKRSDIS
jgi:hypothetical protein